MKYKRIVVTEFGGPSVLRVEEAELPEPGAGEVRVRVQATGVAFADILMRYGIYPGTPKPPFTPGYDIAGTVDCVGAGVREFSAGDAVVALTVRGGYAEYATVLATDLVAVPAGLDPAEATSVVLNYVTAQQLLHRKARVKNGERILVHGAAGGLGTALLQLGALAGLEMIGTASAAKHDVIRSLGATPIDYRSEDFVERVRELAPGGVDVVFDGVGWKNYRRSYRCLRRGGRLMAYGATAAIGNSRGSTSILVGSVVLVSLLGLLPDRRKTGFYSIEKEKKARPEIFREDLRCVLDLLAQGKIRPVMAESIVLDDAARAHELLESASVSGKIVLVCA